MSLKPLRLYQLIGILTGLLLASAGRLTAQTNGIFADFTTSMGNFTCQLDFTNAPKTVANFVGLATGQHSWLDLITGRARNDPFYNGLTFHRVIAGFMNQGGSPNGTGNDGPGYAFIDEFSPRLVFTNVGVLAMANSGKNSNGSQFFITTAPYPSGNNTYSIFGQVVSGMNAVNAINAVATDANNKPLTNVVIQQIAIRRVGAVAQAFDINAQGLPIVTNAPIRVGIGAGQVTLTFSNRLYADERFYSATNLSEPWTEDPMGIEITAPSVGSLQKTNKVPKQFFRLGQVQYASSTFAPRSLNGKTLALVFTNTLTETMTINFNSSGGGTYSFGVYGSGSVTNYSWAQEPYRGFLWPIYFTGLVPMTFELDSSSNTAGGFSGTAYSSFPFSIMGTFSLTGP